MQLVTIALLVVSALVLAVFLMIRTGVAGGHATGEIPRGVSTIGTGPCPFCGSSAAHERLGEACRAALWRAPLRGLVRGCLFSMLFGFISIALTLAVPSSWVVTIPAWVVGPYCYALVAAIRTGAPVVRAGAGGLAVGHTLTVFLAWLALHNLMAGLDVGIGGG